MGGRVTRRALRLLPGMPDVHFTNLLIVAVGLLAPLVLGFFPRFRLPAIVLEIVLGIVIGPSGLGWVKPDLPVSILALVGLAFLLFLSGLEIDVQRLRGRLLKLTAIGFAVSFAIAIVLGLGLKAGGFVWSPLFVAIVLVATSLGVIVPVLKDSGNISSSFGQLVIAAASIADFGAIILLSLFFAGKGSTIAGSRRRADERRRPYLGDRRRDRDLAAHLRRQVPWADRRRQHPRSRSEGPLHRRATCRFHTPSGRRGWSARGSGDGHDLAVDRAEDRGLPRALG